jgi:hypothetical protein
LQHTENNLQLKAMMQGELDKAYNNISREAWDRWLTRAAINRQSEIVSAMQVDQPPAIESLRILRLLLAALVSCESEDIPEAGGPTKVQFSRMKTGVESMISVLPKSLAELWSAELQAALEGEEDALLNLQHDNLAAKLKLRLTGEKPRKAISNFRRIFLASFLAPLSVPVLAVIFYSIAWLFLDSNGIGEIMRYSAFITALISYAYMYILYLPVFLLMRFFGKTGRGYQSMSGFLCIFLPCLPMLLLMPDLNELLGMLALLVFCGLLGALIGGAFWWLGVRENGVIK